VYSDMFRLEGVTIRLFVNHIVDTSSTVHILGSQKV